ncbi:MAG: hypothetical protein JRM74_04675 [Nitrososphaerota archaeon]|nr:hypothetical protein [Nitrososphaerota archaeon]
MKRLLALALVALLLVSIPVAISLQEPRQVDPATAPEDPIYGQGLYLFYGSIVAAISGGNFSAARSLIHQDSFIHIPADVLDAVNSFDGLINSTSALFGTIQSQLGNSSAYLASGRLHLARDNLTAAVSNLRSANQTLSQLFGAEPQLASLTGIPSSLLLQKLQPLETLYVADSAQANRLLTVLTGLTKLEQTNVTLQVAPSAIAIGTNVSVTGTLTGPSGAALASRSVTVYFQNQAIGDLTTSPSGHYSGSFPTPYFYQKNATMFASFLPSGNDSLVYSPSTSAPANVTVSFDTPSVTFVIPSHVNAGQPLSVNGTLSLAGRPLSGYTVSLSGFQTSPLGSSVAASNLTSGIGGFAIQLGVPAGLSGGTYPLVLSTSSNGAIGPLSIPLHVTVIEENPDVTATAPVIALAGFSVTVSGAAVVNGTGLSGAQVLNTGAGPGAAATTNSSGSFSFSVTPPLTTANGPWAYSIEVYPTQSWISAAPATVTIFVINPLVLIFPAGSLGLLGLVVRRRRAPGQVAELAPLGPVAAEAEAPKQRPATGLPGVYFAAVGLVEAATAVQHLPQTTIREYLKAVQGKLKGFEHFRIISALLEANLYGGPRSAADESTANAELASLRREIEG